MLRYKNYFGEVAFDSEAKIFYGEVIGIKDVITFQGETVKELEQAFKDSVDDYLLWCKEREEAPEKTYSGKLHLRITPELHAHLALEALRNKISLNNLISEKLRR